MTNKKKVQKTIDEIMFEYPDEYSCTLAETDNLTFIMKWKNKGLVEETIDFDLETDQEIQENVEAVISMLEDSLFYQLLEDGIDLNKYYKVG